MSEGAVMRLWTVYDKPSDFPDEFVARAYEIGRGVVQPTMEHVTGKTLEDVRAAVQRRDPNVSFPLPRQAGDDPAIVETWI